MNVCTECGTKLQEHLKFCPNCGVNVSKKTDLNKQQPVQSRNHKGFGKKGQMIGIILLLIAVVVFFGAYQYGAQQFSREKQVQSFIQAVNKEDAKTLVTMMKSNDPTMKIKEEDIKAYFAYLKDNPSYKRDLLLYLNNQKSENIGIQSKTTFTDVQIAQDGKKWIFFPEYKLQVMPYYIEVSTNTEGATILVNDKETDKSKNANYKKEIGPYFPGSYRLKATSTSDLASLETEEEAVLANQPTGKVSVNLSLIGDYVTVQSDEMDADVYVNGKKKGILKNGSYKLGPVSTDGSVEVHLEKQYDWGKAKTQSIYVGGNSSYFLSFPRQVTTDDVRVFIQNHLQKSTRAIYLNDFSLIANDYDPSGKSLEEDRNYLKQLSDKKTTESLLTFEVRDVQRISETQFKVKTFEEYNIYYADGTGKHKTFDSEYLLNQLADGKLVLHSLLSNTTLKSEDLNGFFKP
ncbi:zinc ribbon domain-containing protein [Ectobacillus sp. sgz5001026]|uniref:zinc ribbon domain-containing protein n=1 Tax=Ectobacillus sp. sgz5001026 TaxID=3242473 RepID=UPI0036D30306